AESPEQLREQITSVEPRPPRQIDDHIPKELERICLKALAKRASERYSTALDVAEDLLDWSVRRGPASQAEDAKQLSTATAFPQPLPGQSTTESGLRTPNSAEPVKIVPKG